MNVKKLKALQKWRRDLKNELVPELLRAHDATHGEMRVLRLRRALGTWVFASREGAHARERTGVGEKKVSAGSVGGCRNLSRVRD